VTAMGSLCVNQNVTVCVAQNPRNGVSNVNEQGSRKGRGNARVGGVKRTCCAEAR
jgi:hypothetical protein